MNKNLIIKNLLFFVATVLIFSFGFNYLYLYDNKYTKTAQKIQAGGVAINTQHPLDDETTALVYNWEIYPDEILTPQQINNNNFHKEITYIGQYPNFSKLSEFGLPHGYATYRLIIHNSGKPSNKSLYLPEIFSAYKLYVNGEIVHKSGSISPYRPFIQDSVVNIELDKKTEIVIQTSNFSHYYGGIYYPPIIGSPQKISQMITSRMLFYGFICFSTLAMALFSIAVWLTDLKRSEHHLYFYFGALSLSFAIRVCYPFFHALGLPGVGFLYAIEDTATFAGIYYVIRILLILCKTDEKWIIKNLILPISLGMCLIGFLVPLFLLPNLPALINIYGQVVSWYKLITAVIMLLFVLHKNSISYYKFQSSFLLMGVSAYAVGLFLNVIYINRYEPIISGWQDEYGSFLMVICFAVIMVKHNSNLVSENIRLTESLELEVAKQTSEITGLINERQKLLSGLLHDIKSPLSSILVYNDMIKKNAIQLDENTKYQLQVIEDKCKDVSGRVRMIQEYTSKNEIQESFKEISLNNLISQFYQLNKPDIEAFGAHLKLKMTPFSCIILGNSSQLARVMENLVYNALNFISHNGKILIGLQPKDGLAILTVSDNGTGICDEFIGKIFDENFTTRQSSGGTGMGLSIVNLILKEHGGTISVKSKLGEGTIFTITIPLVLQSK